MSATTLRQPLSAESSAGIARAWQSLSGLGAALVSVVSCVLLASFEPAGEGLSDLHAMADSARQLGPDLAAIAERVLHR